jgi:hypothetical protein
MKFATLMMVAAVSAAASTCPKPTATEQKAIDAAKKLPGYAATEAAFKKALPAKITAAEKSLKTATTALTACHTKEKATTDALKKTADALTGACGTEALAVKTDAGILQGYKCASADSGGATVIIIIVVVVVLCCAAGLAYYFCVHKKKQAAASGDAPAADVAANFNKDDLYMAFIDNETA